ncbi:hypothetical protein CRYUN_Cryun05aG0149700 [Craigia yunnanensis]
MGFSKEEKSRRIWRGVKTVFFLITMVISFLVFSAPVFLVIADTLLPSALLSASLSPSSLSFKTLSSHFSNYDFRCSLIDIPLISIIRSAVIICVYSFCDRPGLSRGPYLGITMICSVSSLIFVSLKASFVFSSSVPREVYVTAMETSLFICSLALAIAHIIVAYRTSCRERRKLLIYKIDIEAVLRADIELNFVVNKISINRIGSALLLAGSDDLCVMYLYGRTSTKDNTIICRTVSIGSQIYSNDSSAIHILQVSWHPCSDTHVGILSSDSVFRLFDLSSDVMQSEQEYYLQPVEPGRSKNAASICPVEFSFVGDHLRDRFSVFVLFSDGSIYILCPVVPFGSVYKWESILEMYTDARTFGLKSANSAAVNNSNLAISWLEATFPEIAQQATDGENPSTLKAHSHALFDASFAPQGPLRKVCRAGEDEALAVRGAECEDRAVIFLYNLVSKDSILVTAWSGGQLQIDALADEIQPVWITGSAPRLHVDSHNHVLGIAMICESIPAELSIVKLDQPLDNTVWLGHPPPLLRLAVVDLALPRKIESSSRTTMFVDPLMPKRIYSLREGGVDLIVLHFLPFTSQINGKDESIKTPSVHAVLSTCQGETSSPSPYLAVSLSDSFGYSWVVVVPSTQECVVLEIKNWYLLLPIQVDKEKHISLEEQKREILQIS